MRASKKRRRREAAKPEAAESARAALIAAERYDWSGPLPPPAALHEFDQLVENGAERIFGEWELEAAHRRDYETRALKAQIWLDLLGRVTAFVFAMTALGLAGWCAAMGETLVATVLGGGTIGAVVGALVYKETVARRSN